MKRLIFVLSLVLLGLFAAQGEAQTLCIGPNCPGTGGGGGGTDLTIGVSTITGGTNARVLYDNGGVVGEYTITGTGNVVLSTAPRFGGTVNFGTASTTTGSIAMFKAGSAFGVTIGTTDQTVGSVALTIPDFASVADTFVFTTLAQTLSNKTFVAPALGTPASGVMTNVTGTASGLTAGNVTTNANLTGPITSVGNATTVADSELAALAGLTSAQNKIPIFTGAGTAGLFDPQTGNSCTDAVGTDAYACSTPTCPTALADNQRVIFQAGTANTLGATFAYCGLAAKALVKTVGGISTTLATGDILAKQPILAVYNATDDNWKMISAVSTAGGGSPGGSDTQVQFNDSGAFGGDAGMVYNKTTDSLALSGRMSVQTNVGLDCTNAEYSFAGYANTGIGYYAGFGDLMFCVGGSLKAYIYSGDSSFAFLGAIVPINSEAANIGSTGNRWKALYLGRTITAGGTTGAQTINKSTGTVNFAAAATTLVVTNSLVTTSSIILLTPQTADTTCIAFAAVRAAGSFTITANAACAAETVVGFLVTN